MSKTIVVSGGTKGIGRAIINRFAKEEWHVITCARSLTDLNELKSSVETVNSKISVFQADLSNRNDTTAFIAFARAASESIDVLVNNTGTFEPGELLSEEEGKLKMMMDTNLYSAYNLSRGIIPNMILNKTGDVFNICSVASLKAYPNGGSYSISKFAMYGLSQGLREELKPHGIRVTSVLPGATLTASWDGVDLPESRFIKAEDVAESIWGAYSLSRNTVIEDLVIRPQLGDI